MGDGELQDPVDAVEDEAVAAGAAPVEAEDELAR